MVLPVLLFLFVLIFSFANTHIGRTRSMIQSKNKAWKARHADEGSLVAENVGSFDPGRQLHRRLGRGSAAPGLSRRSHETPVSIARFLSPSGRAAKTSHAVLGGAYDHRSLRFDEGGAMVPSGRLLVFAESAAGDLLRGTDRIDAIGTIADRIWGRIRRLRAPVDRIQRLANAVMDLDAGAAKDLVGLLGDLGQVPGQLTGLTSDVAELGRLAGNSVNTTMPRLVGVPTWRQLLQAGTSLENMVRRMDDFKDLMNMDMALWRGIGTKY